MFGKRRKWTAATLAGGLGALVALAGCGGDPSVASKSAAAFREAEKRGETFEDAAGSHGHGALSPSGHDAMGQQESQDGMAEMDHGAKADQGGMAGMDHGAAGHSAGQGGMAGMDPSAMEHGGTAGMNHGAAGHSAGQGGMSGMDHSAMEHGGTAGMNDGAAGHSAVQGGMSGMDHSAMEHGGTAGMDHGAAGHSAGQGGMSGMDHGAMGHQGDMDHAAAPAAVAPLAASPGQPARTLSPGPLDSPVATSVLDAQRLANMSEGMGGMQGMGHGGHGEGTYRQVDAGRGPGAHQASEEQVPGAGPHEHGQATTPPSGREEAKAVYTCPMHPEVASKTPGKCPKCGMTLVERRKG